jgi:hypothetical protein
MSHIKQTIQLVYSGQYVSNELLPDFNLVGFFRSKETVTGNAIIILGFSKYAEVTKGVSQIELSAFLFDGFCNKFHGTKGNELKSTAINHL